MNSKYLFLLFGIFLFGSVSAVGLCIDHTAPDSVNVITHSGNMNNLLVSWNEPLDSPICSGINYYNVYKNGKFLLNTTLTEFNDSLSYGSTTYTIFTIDLAGHSSNESILTLEYTENNPSISSSGGGGSSSTVWECSDWTGCINNSKSQNCVDKYNPNVKKTLTAECFPDFVPLTESPQLLTSETDTPKEEIKETKSTSNGFNRITGQAVSDIGEFATSTTGTTSIGFVIILIGLFIFVRRKRK